jgi:glycopeptide antibiotics resistance protein
VLLFMPLSFLGHSFRPRWGWVAWTSFGLASTASVELLQMLLLPGRSPAFEDIVANTLGALLGYLLVRAVATARTRA